VPPRTTLAAIRLEALRLAGHGFDGTADASACTNTLLVDAALSDVGIDTEFLNAAWIYTPGAAAAADYLRRAAESPFVVATGGITPTRAWATAPDGLAYQIYPLVPPINAPGVPLSWNRAVNAGLREVYFRDSIIVGRGRGSSARRFNLTSAETVLVAMLAVQGGTGVTITPPSGWTLILRTNTSADLAVATYWKRAAENDGHDFSFGLDQSRAAAGVVVAYSDVNTEDPVDASAGEAATPASTTATATTASSTVVDTRILRFYGGADAASMSGPSGHLERADAGRDDSDNDAEASAAAYDIDQSSVGSAGAADATLNIARINIGQTVILQPRAGKQISFIDSSTRDNGSGATTLDLPRPSGVSNDDWTPNEDSIRRVWSQGYATDGDPSERDYNKRGRWWEVRQDGPDETLILGPYGPSTREDVVIEVHRPYPPLAADTDESYIPVNLGAHATVWQLYKLLNKAPVTRGQFAGEEKAAHDDFLLEYAKQRPSGVIVGI
jgi:hypothetical protein